MMAEWRQRAERFPLPLPVRYRISGADGWSDGHAHNISGSGILFDADRELPVGTQIEMHLAMEADGKRYPSEVVAKAQIVRVAAPRSGSSGVDMAASFQTHQMLPRRSQQV